MNISSFLQADAQSPQFTTVSALLSDSILKAWQLHLKADFSGADRIFSAEFLQQPSVETGTCWGLSLRYRGDCQRAIGILQEVWELAKAHGDRAFQLEACCQLMISYRELGDPISHLQFQQMAIRLALDTRTFCGLPEVIQLELARDARRTGVTDRNVRHQNGFSQFVPTEADADRFLLRAESAFCSKKFHEASLAWGRAVELYLHIGHFQGAIAALERKCEFLLSEGLWCEALRELSCLVELTETRKMLSKLKEASRWKGKIQRAMRLLYPESPCLN